MDGMVDAHTTATQEAYGHSPTQGTDSNADGTAEWPASFVHDADRGSDCTYDSDGRLCTKRAAYPSTSQWWFTYATCRSRTTT